MNYQKQWDKELGVLRAIIQKLPLECSIKWGAEVYTYHGSNVVSYGGFKNYFAVWFYKGVFMSDPLKVLVNAQEGKTKSLRQWRFSALGELQEEKLVAYILEAIEIEEKGLKIEIPKFEPLPVPPFFAAVLKEQKGLQQAFERLSGGKQKEYILYLTEAKQEATRQKRLEKIIPMILDGKGLNDRYK